MDSTPTQSIEKQASEDHSDSTPVGAANIDDVGAIPVAFDNPDGTSDNLDEVIPPHTPQSMPIIGLGGSAGAIPALRTFFRAMPADSGMAFVVIIHLSPEHESTLPELLQLNTRMPVIGVREPTPVAANHVYVISPNVHLVMNDGHILPQALEIPERGRRVAVDLFFRSLADTHGTRAAGIVLSGGDSDGVIGLKRLKERGGLTIAQDPGEAEHDSMPRSAIATGMVDWIMPVEMMPERLVQYQKNEKALRLPPEAIAARQTGQQQNAVAEYPAQEKQNDEIALREVLAFLRARTGHDFTSYKRATVLRRLGRRLQVNSLRDIPSYVEYLRTNPGEATALLQDLLISVTNFFRDPEAFEILQQKLPRVFEDKTGTDQLRVWVAGCATGEEAYSVTMLLLEYAARLPEPPSLLVFATDLSVEAIQSAREGRYPETIQADVSPERLRRFFTHEPGCYRVRKEVRECVLFAPHNLLKDSPFSRLDLITCRNLLIYLNREAQRRAFETFHFALRPEGILLLGTSESADDVPQLFSPVDKKYRLYIKWPSTRQHLPPLPAPAMRSPLLSPSLRPISWTGALSDVDDQLSSENMDAHSEIERIVASAPNMPRSQPRASNFGDLHLRLLERYAPPSVVINESYDIMHLTETAGRFLQFSGGEPSMNLLEVVHPSLRSELSSALFTAMQQHEDFRITSVPMESGETTTLVDIHVRPEPDTDSNERGLILVFFQEAGQTQVSSVESTPTRSDSVVRRLEDELQHVKASLRVTVEQYEASVEELKASNEELQASNEEARSTTEELETSKEELQAVNEELTTVNHELKSKIDEVSNTNSDLQNLIASTEIATIFLDSELRIKRYTPRAARIFNIIPTDIKRPLSDLTNKLQYTDLAGDAQKAIDELATVERETGTNEGHWLLTRVLPYRTADNRIDGVVITFLDITERKRTEEALRQTEEQFRRALEDAPIPVIMQAEDGEVLQVSRSWTELTGYTLEDVPTADAWLGRAYGEGADAVRAHMQDLFSGSTKSLNADFIIRTRHEAGRHWSFSASSPGVLRDGRRFIIGMAVDITERKLAETALLESEKHFLIAGDAAGMGAWDWNLVTGKIRWNDQHYQLFGLEPDGEPVDYHTFEQFIHPEDRQMVRERIDNALQSGAPYSADFRVKLADASIRWMSSYGRIIEPDEGKPTRMVGVMYDSTLRKEAEEALRESEERFRLLVEGTKDYAMFLMDENRTIVHWNSGAERVFGWTREEAIGQSGDMIFTPEDRKRGEAEREAEVARRDGRAIDRRWHIRKEGSRFWADGVMSSLSDENGGLRGFVKIARDKTRERQTEQELQRAHDEMEQRVVDRTLELGQANAKLRKHTEDLQRTEAERQQLLQRLVMAQEDERKRISRELHDQMGQTLTALKVGLSTQGAANVGGADNLFNLNRLLDELVKQVHHLAWELRPALLDNFGLGSALEQYVNEWSRQSGVAADFASRGFTRTQRMSPHAETAFYRVVQEALTNVQRHAGATQVSVVLERVRNEVSVIIEDNGKGIKKPSKNAGRGRAKSGNAESTSGTAAAPPRLGLVGMRERMELIGGTLNIESKPGSGTTIYARAPYERRSTPRSESTL